MPKISIHLWYDKEAKEAAKFYTEAFSGVFDKSLGESVIKHINVLKNTPSGSVDIVTINLLGEEFTLISAGPYFKLNPSISFLIACDSKDQVDALWKKLSDGGKDLMPMDKYPFSDKYVWLEDKYGLSWQIMYMGNTPITQRITPTLMFVGEQCGRAEEAVNFYISVFSENSRAGQYTRYGKGEDPDREGTVKHVNFTLSGKQFGAMDSAHQHKFAFNEAISIMVHCQDQKEIDYYWGKLSAVPEAEQCGWLKDKFGVSWQIVPTDMDQMLSGQDQAKIARVTEAFLKMKKFDLAKLRAAADGQ